MKKINPYILLLGLAASTMACENLQTVVELDVPDIDPQLTINALVNTDSAWSVLVTGHRYVLDSEEIPYIDGATVKLFSGSEELGSTSTHTNGFYNLPITPEEGREYRVEVSHPDYPTASATTKVEEPVYYDELAFDLPNDLRNFEGRLQGSITLSDPANVRNYYHLVLFSTIDFPVGLGSNGDTLFERYEYAVYFQLGEGSTDGIIEVNADAFGWFEGQVFSDELFDGRTITFNFDFNNDAYLLPEGSKWQVKADFRSLSEDYYKYLGSYGIQRNTQGNPFAQPAQVFTNVEGGLGIVAGYSRASNTYIFLD